MTSDKIRAVIDEYEAELPQFLDMEPPVPQDLQHCLEMIPQIRTFLNAGRVEKAMRWLGFIQGVLWAQSIYSLEQLKEHNRAVVSPG